MTVTRPYATALRLWAMAKKRNPIQQHKQRSLK